MVSNRLVFKNLMGVAVISAFTILAIHPTSADARERKTRDTNRTATWSGKSEGSATQRIDRERGSASRDTTWQNSRGTGSSNYDRNFNKDDKTMNSSRLTTNAQGKTATTNSVGTRTDTGYNKSSTRTGFNGETSTKNTDFSKTDNGYSKDSVYNGQNGNSVTSSKDVVKTDDGYDVNRNVTTSSGKTLNTDSTVVKTDSGFNRTGTYTTGAGNSGSYYKNTIKTDDGRTVNSGITNQDGKTVTKDVVATHKDGVWTRDTDRTGPKGNTLSNTIGGTYSRTTNP
jgi:hypothetical protein